MPSLLAWVDHDAVARERALRILALFQERESRDELGLGGVRDSFADQLFPGTSTIQTRLRYMLIVPWVYMQLEDKRVVPQDFANLADRAERDLVGPLLKSDDRAGVFGRTAGRQVKRLPSSVYWAGLGAWGIRLTPYSQEEYHRRIGDVYRARTAADQAAKEAVRRGDDRDAASSQALTWHPRIPAAPDRFPESIDFSLTSEEAEFLLDRIAIRQHIVLISCVKSKLEAPAPAGELYVSTWFRLAMAYARSLRPDTILILSAKHGVLKPDAVIAPYEESLNGAGVAARRRWAAGVLSQLREVADFDRDEFTFLAGARYRELLMPHIAHHHVPMEGLRQGEQLQFLVAQAGGAGERRDNVSADAELRAEFVEVRRGGNATVVLVREIHWDGPHTPRSNWTVFRELPQDAGEQDVSAAVCAALADGRFFRVCTRCARKKPAGWMHTDTICQSCAERHLGVVY